MKKYIDITNDMINNARPNSHKVEELHYFIDKNINIHIVDGKNVILDYSTKELEIANWIVNTFGGKIYMLPKVNYPKNIKTPDYLWKNEYWDLKCLSEKATSNTRAVDNILKLAKSQANNFILDISQNKINKNIILNQTKEIFDTKGREWIKIIIIINKSKILKILKRK